MPLPYRVPFQATCGVFWTLYLSLLTSRSVSGHIDNAWTDPPPVNQQLRKKLLLIFANESPRQSMFL